MTSPADTIREGIESDSGDDTAKDAALAALTELEQQLAAVTERPDRSVTDLETTALDILKIPPGRRTVTDEQDCFAAVRELARQLREAQAEVGRMVTALDGMARAPYGEYQAMHDRAEAAEADRDRLQARVTHMENALIREADKVLAAEADRDRLADTLLAAYDWIDNEMHTAPGDLEGGHALLIAARAALATPEETT